MMRERFAALWCWTREASGTVATIMVIVFAILGAAVFVTASCNGEPPVERMERKGCR